MQLFLSLADSYKDSPNENYARELMELFTLGSGYTERDVREAARALTGWRIKRVDGQVRGVWFDETRHDAGRKQLLGARGRFATNQVLDLVVDGPRHAPFLVSKLWSYFVTEPPDRATVRDLTRTYRRSGLRILPVVERILGSRALYAHLDAPDMVKSPVVYVAGILRGSGTPITTGAYGYLLDQMGQVPFHPPSVAGWDWGPTWLTTGTIKARMDLANVMIGWREDAPLFVPDAAGHPGLAPGQQLQHALDALGRPWISDATRGILTGLAAGYFSDLTEPWQKEEKPQAERAAMLQRVLRNLLLTGPDAHLH
jgi:uncharacterized protein (DUF1800 family)